MYFVFKEIITLKHIIIAVKLKKIVFFHVSRFVPQSLWLRQGQPIVQFVDNNVVHSIPKTAERYISFVGR